jgi:hypothetical protein
METIIQTKEDIEKEQSIKLRLSTNLENTYIEEEKEKLWLCLKELRDMAWQFDDEGTFKIFKNIFCHDKDIDVIFKKVKGNIKDSLIFFKIDKTVLDFLACIILSDKERQVSDTYSIIEKELCKRFKEYQEAGFLKRKEIRQNKLKWKR